MSQAAVGSRTAPGGDANVAFAAPADLYWIYRHRDTSSGQYGKDPVCGM